MPHTPPGQACAHPSRQPALRSPLCSPPVLARPATALHAHCACAPCHSPARTLHTPFMPPAHPRRARTGHDALALQDVHELHALLGLLVQGLLKHDGARDVLPQPWEGAAAGRGVWVGGWANVVCVVVGCAGREGREQTSVRERWLSTHVSRRPAASHTRLPHLNPAERLRGQRAWVCWVLAVADSVHTLGSRQRDRKQARHNSACGP